MILQDPETQKSFRSEVSNHNVAIFIGINIHDPSVANLIQETTSNIKTALFWGSSQQLQLSNRLNGYAPATAGPLGRFAAAWLGWTPQARASRVMTLVQDLWSRYTSGRAACLAWLLGNMVHDD